MKLVTFLPPNTAGRGILGAMLEGQVVDMNTAMVCYLLPRMGAEHARAAAARAVPRTMLSWLRTGEAGRRRAREVLDFVGDTLRREQPLSGPRSEPVVYAGDAVRLLAPLPQPNSIRDFPCFAGHGGTSKSKDWYEVPSYYRGNQYAIIGPEDTIPWPSYCDRLDYELGYGFYIGKRGRDIPRAEAADYIGGFTIFNDISARDARFQHLHSPGKIKDFCNVMGPFLVTPDEVDPTSLRMEARVNGETWSQGITSTQYWTLGELIEYASIEETLYPGDFFGTGTVAGGCGMDNGRWLKPGDVIELEIQALGVLRNRVGPRPEVRRSLRLRHHETGGGP